MPSPHLLIVEDDELVQSLMGAFLRRDGFSISLATTGREMLAAIDTESIDLVLLDLNLPDEDSLSLARQVRARSDLPIIVVTAQRDDSYRLAAMEIGANDYLTKPFDPDTLVKRVRNLINLPASPNDPAQLTETHQFGDWKINIDSRNVTSSDGPVIEFTRAEFNLLSALVKAPDRVLTRAYLLDAVSHDADSPTERLIDVLISRIRKKIEPDPRKPRFITTVVGCGYKFSTDPN
jgi:DNA-binding response OmpR family regulator